ncbi:hypothetical protein WH47_08857, partial [Habropoda laboriosa]
CAYTGSCKCDAYVILVWPMTSSVLLMTFTATTPCPCSFDVHPGQASTSLITKDSANDLAKYIFRLRFLRSLHLFLSIQTFNLQQSRHWYTHHLSFLPYKIVHHLFVSQ